MAVTTRTAFASALARRPAWHLVDAREHILGRLATQIARVINGKHKPCWEPSFDCGDYVVVINCDQIKLSHPAKWQHKTYRWHTGWPGGLKEVTAQRMLDTHPTRLLEKAVHGMLPKNRLLQGRERKLRLFAGPAHPHQAQIEDPLNQAQLQALAFPWQTARPTDTDPLADPAFHPGWMLHFESEGDFTVAHGMRLAPRPRSKVALKNWRPSDQLKDFSDALDKHYQPSGRVISSE